MRQSSREVSGLYGYIRFQDLRAGSKAVGDLLYDDDGCKHRMDRAVIQEVFSAMAAFGDTTDGIWIQSTVEVPTYFNSKVDIIEQELK